MKQVSESIEQDNLVLVYSVNYRENIILGSVIGKFRKLTELCIETSIDNVLCQHYELFVKNSYGDFIPLLDRGQVPQNLERWKIALSSWLGRKMQEITNQSVTSGCPACSKHQKCPQVPTVRRPGATCRGSRAAHGWFAHGFKSVKITGNESWSSPISWKCNELCPWVQKCQNL